VTALRWNSEAGEVRGRGWQPLWCSRVVARLLRGLAGTPVRRSSVDAAAQGLCAAGLYWCGG